MAYIKPAKSRPSFLLVTDKLTTTSIHLVVLHTMRNNCRGDCVCLEEVEGMGATCLVVEIICKTTMKKPSIQ